MSKSLSIENLRGHLFEALEGVKNLSDEQASPCEQTSIEQAQAIVDISSKIIDTYKVQLDAFRIASKMDGVNNVSRIMEGAGLLSEDQTKQIGM